MSESTDLEPFKFNEFEIRFVGTPDDPEWVGADVVNVLYPAAIKNKNQSTYLSRIPNEWKGSKEIATLGGRQSMTTVYEPGLYSLIAKSESPLAVSFQKWVYEEVLPSIRQTGSYSTTQQSSSNLIPPAKERLANIRLGMDLLYELGGVDERTQLALRDIVRDVLLEGKLKKPVLPSGGRAEWPVSDRARHLGFNPDKKALMKIGKTAAKLYRLAHDGEGPPEREQFVDGTTRMVKCYGEPDLDILDSAISLVMTPLAALPLVDDADDEF